MNKEYLLTRFKEIYQTNENTRIFFSPGRINLIGEHIDYNGGSVFPCAITYGTYAVIKERTDTKITVYSDNFQEQGILSFDLQDLRHTKDEHFTVYIKGVCDEFTKAGYTLTKGFDAYIIGTIPNGSGLSSSASLELLFSMILKNLHQLEVSTLEMVQLSQKAENNYASVNCGIMDQFAIGFGKKDKAIRLHTGTLDYEYADCELEEYKILIMNTNQKRELADSKYNERRSECDKAVALLNTKKKITYLCDLDMNEFTKVSSVLKDEVLYKRAKHAISENERVKEAIEVLQKKDLTRFGQLLNESHTSLKEDYEVTGLALDTIVSLAQAQKGVLGARMTGAGFGGCAIALVHQDHLEEVQEIVGKEYYLQTNKKADFYIASIGDGTKEII